MNPNIKCEEAQLWAHWPGALVDDGNLEVQREREEALALHLTSCEQCHTQLDALASLDQMIDEGPLAAMVLTDDEIPSAMASYARFEAMLNEAEEAVEQGLFGQLEGLWRRWVLSPAWAIPAAIAAVVVLTLGPFGDAPGGLSRHRAALHTPGQWGVKGHLAPVFDLLVAAPDHSVRGFGMPRLAVARQLVHPGDFLQLRYTMPLSTHVMVVSLNERGKLFAYLPLAGRRSVPLAAGSGTLPPKSAWELDDALGQERMYVLIGMRPFGLDVLKKALSQASMRRRLPLCRQIKGPWWCRSFFLRKKK